MNIVVVGTGYVGLVSGACFSEFGFAVTCVDKDLDKITSLEKGEIPIYEPGLDDFVKRNSAAGRLRFTTELGPAVGAADGRRRPAIWAEEPGGPRGADHLPGGLPAYGLAI